MFVQQKEDYLSPTCLSMELAAESFICTSVEPSIELGLELLQDDTYEWLLF